MYYALIDWDNTIHQGYTIYGLADHLLERKLVSDQLIHTFNELISLYQSEKISYAEYTERTCESFAMALAGCSVLTYQSAVLAFRPSNESALFKDAHSLFQLLRKYNIHAYLVSGAPFDMLKTYADLFGLSGIFAFQLEEENGILTGRVASNYGLNKERILSHPLFQAPDSVHLLNMGDAVADIPLLDHSLIPIVVGEHQLSLRSGSETMYFSGTRWDLQLLEEKIKNWIANSK